MLKVLVTTLVIQRWTATIAITPEVKMRSMPQTFDETDEVLGLSDAFGDNNENQPEVSYTPARPTETFALTVEVRSGLALANVDAYLDKTVAEDVQKAISKAIKAKVTHVEASALGEADAAVAFSVQVPMEGSGTAEPVAEAALDKVMNDLMTVVRTGLLARALGSRRLLVDDSVRLVSASTATYTVVRGVPETVAVDPISPFDKDLIAEANAARRFLEEDSSFSFDFDPTASPTPQPTTLAPTSAPTSISVDALFTQQCKSSKPEIDLGHRFSVLFCDYFVTAD